MMDLAATLLPATPSQLSSSILATGGCKSCSLPVLRWETVSLSETLRLDNETGSQGSCKLQVHLYLQNLQLHDLQMVAGICVHRRVRLPIINLLNQTPGIAIFPAELPPHF